MRKKERASRLVLLLFVVYLVILVWIILFKLQLSISELDYNRSVNLIPFYYSNSVGTKFHLKEVLENVFVFVPFGIYLSMLKGKLQFWKKAALIFTSSLALETAQYILAVGSSDITDIITNTIGGILGIGSYHLIVKILRNRERADNAIIVLATIVTVLLISGIVFIFMLN